MRGREVDTASINLTSLQLSKGIGFKSTLKAACHLPTIEELDPRELAVSNGAAITKGLTQTIAPLWLYNELFGDIDAGRSDGGDLKAWEAIVLNAPRELRMTLPTFD